MWLFFGVITSPCNLYWASPRKEEKKMLFVLSRWVMVRSLWWALSWKDYILCIKDVKTLSWASNREKNIPKGQYYWLFFWSTDSSGLCWYQEGPCPKMRSSLCFIILFLAVFSSRCSDLSLKHSFSSTMMMISHKYLGCTKRWSNHECFCQGFVEVSNLIRGASLCNGQWLMQKHTTGHNGENM